jgi:signal peptidase I
VDSDDRAEKAVPEVPILGRGPSSWQKRRARKEGLSLARSARRALNRHGHRLSKATREEIGGVADELEASARKADHEATCAAMVKLDDLEHRHLAFAKKSAFREYADSIGVAVLVALLLRAFVVEAFKIPSGSMIPTLEVGDHIFVNKFIYGLRIPFTKIKFFEWRKPKRGEVVVFIYPSDPDKDFIKRIVAVEGDRIAVRRDVLYVNGEEVPHQRMPGLWSYWDLVDERNQDWDQKVAIRVNEQVNGERYMTIHEPHSSYLGDYPRDGGEAYTVPPGSVFVLGDNRNNSHDSRFWGPVPLENIKGKAMVVWWSSGGPDGIRWERLGHLVE